MKHPRKNSLLVCVLLVLELQDSLHAAGETASQTLVWPDGTRYIGGVPDGKRSGQGTIFWPDGTRFVGSFSNDLREGQGTMVLPNGRVLNGISSNDALVGTATTVDPETMPASPAAKPATDEPPSAAQDT